MTKLHFKGEQRKLNREKHQINKRMSKQFALVPLAQKCLVRSFVHLFVTFHKFFFQLSYAYRSNAESYINLYYILLYV